ncbi:pyridoxamine 5'-phosphate oxidase family protein [Galbibacter sp. PAP.153]|uniref:pyridoxamine 5'-phosphate oxidase family protein n=1 Tax=Galbibacter sp. PAP.153 TaxID=3104623 RepID=UPI00300BC1F2
MKTENLSHTEAIKKIKEIIEGTKTAILLTDLDTLPLGANPMETKKIEDDGSIWFLSSLNSDHYSNILADKRVQLLYSNPEDKQFLSMYGKAFIYTDKELLEELYTKKDDRWFDGVDDIELIAIKVIPLSTYYWDKKQNKFIELIKDFVENKSTEKHTEKDVKGKLKR